MAFAHDATLQNMSTEELLAHAEPIMHLVGTTLDWELYTRLQDATGAIAELRTRLADYEDTNDDSDEHPAVRFAECGRRKRA